MQDNNYTVTTTLPCQNSIRINSLHPMR